MNKLGTAFVASFLFFTTTQSRLFAQWASATHALQLPILITLGNGESGSGFFIATSNHFFLATAAHVLFDASTGHLRSDTAELAWPSADPTNSSTCRMQANLAKLQADNNIRINTPHDVAVVRCGLVITNNATVYRLDEMHVISNAEPVMVHSSDVRKLKDVNVGDDVYIFGYPSSVGLKQSPKFDYSKPLLRKGVVSGIYNQAQTITIDAAVYFGNSGGPVFEAQQLGLGQESYTIIGVTTEIIPFVDVSKNETYHYSNVNVSNSGYSVVQPVDFILQLLWDN
jgi:hypothetical protein